MDRFAKENSARAWKASVQEADGKDISICQELTELVEKYGVNDPDVQTRLKVHLPKCQDCKSRYRV